MIRTFIAVELPDSFQEALHLIKQKMNIKGLKPVETGLVHVTIKFLGDIPEFQVEPIADSLTKINLRPFTARIANVGVFPKPSYVKVIWLGAHGEFELLHSEVERVLKNFNFKKDRGKFTSHATLARVKHLDRQAKKQLAKILTELQDIELGEFPVSSITFKKSTLTPEGSIYETLKEIPLGN
jgi:2'-5' RNA ligase